MIFNDIISDNNLSENSNTIIENDYQKYSKYSILKDTVNQKEYLIFKSSKNLNSAGSVETIKIIQDNHQILKTLISNDSSVSFYIEAKNDVVGDRNYILSNGKPLLYKDSRIDVHDSYIYYITNGLEPCGVVEEYRLTIENDLAKETKTRTYYDNQLTVSILKLLTVLFI